MMEYLSYVLLVALILLILYPVSLIIYGLVQGCLEIKKRFEEDEKELCLLQRYLEDDSDLKEFQITIDIPKEQGKTVVTLPGDKKFYFHYHNEIVKFLKVEKLG